MKNERIILLLLALIQFTHIVDFMIMMPLGPRLMESFHINPQQFSIVVSSYAISAFFSAVLGAYYMDKYDRKSTMLVLFTGFVLGTLACGLAPDYKLMVLARSLTGAFGGLLGGLIMSVIGDIIPQERRASAMGQVMAAFSVASVLGVPFGLFLSARLGWNAPFIFLTLISLPVLFALARYMPSITLHLQNRRSDQHFFSLFINTAKDNNQLRALLLTILLVIGQFSVVPFISSAMVFNVGFKEEQLTYIYLLGGAFTMFTAPLIGKLADRHGRWIVFAVLAVLSVGPVYAITHLGKSDLWVALLITTLFFIFSGRMVAAMTMVTSSVPAESRGGFMSLNSAVQQLASGLASFISGMIVVQGSDKKIQNYEQVGYLAIVAILLTIVLARTLKIAHDPKKEPVVTE